jgi:hypothetical protein
MIIALIGNCRYFLRPGKFIREVFMPATSKRPKRLGADISGETFEVLNVLAAILAVTTLKSSSGEKGQLGEEFASAFDILTNSLVKCYEKASPATRKKMERSSVAAAKKLQQFAKGIGVCCVGCQRAGTRRECMDCSPDADWACKRPGRILTRA